jgi:putative spermidine/putrescine transport system permease protein
LPFFAYALLFLFIPAGEVIVGAFKDNQGAATFDHIQKLVHQPYVDQYWLSIKISLITAGLGCVLAHGFTLFGERGVELVYLYFQIPLMILVIAPAIDGLRAEWREAASNLGASSWQYWRHVGIPVLLPSFLGAFILLFGNSFSAYATAYGLAANGISIVPITIGFYYSGNVLFDPHFAAALAFGMFVVLAVMMVLYVPLQRRSARWMR